MSNDDEEIDWLQKQHLHNLLEHHDLLWPEVILEMFQTPMEGATSELEIDSELVMSFYDQYQVTFSRRKTYK